MKEATTKILTAQPPTRSISPLPLSIIFSRIERYSASTTSFMPHSSQVSGSTSSSHYPRIWNPYTTSPSPPIRRDYQSLDTPQTSKSHSPTSSLSTPVGHLCSVPPQLSFGSKSSHSPPVRNPYISCPLSSAVLRPLPHRSQGCGWRHRNSYNRMIFLTGGAGRFSSNPSLPESGDNNDSDSTYPEEKYFSESTNRLISQDESNSIRRAISNVGLQRRFAECSPDLVAEAMNKSILTYLDQKAKRSETGRDPISNPGYYVRTIVRKQLEVTVNNGQEENALTHIDVVSAGQGVKLGDKDKTSEIQDLLKRSNVNPDELNESCLHALAQQPVTKSKYALETYAKQKKMRDINHPSAYVMTVLRNAPDDSTSGTFPAPLISKHSRAADNYKQQQSEDKALVDEEEVRLEPESVLREVSPFSTTEMSFSMNKSTPETNVAVSKADGAIITMEVVDKCISCLRKLEQPITSLPGVGPKAKDAINKLGIFTVRDVLWYFPRRFVDRSLIHSDVRRIANGDTGTLLLTIRRDKHNAVSCIDGAGNPVDVVFLYGSSKQGLMIASAEKAKLCNTGSEKMIVSGKLTLSDKGYTMFNPDVIVHPDSANNVLGIEPVYGLSAGLSQKKLIKAIESALAVAEDLRLLPESLSDDILSELSWPKLVDAINLAHKPRSMKDAGVDSPVMHRIAFEELCVQQALLALIRWKLKHPEGFMFGSNNNGYKTWRDSPFVSDAVKSLPFELTISQMDCLDEMWTDAISANNGRMARLLQGDVGSGKTVLAYLLGLGCVESRQGGGAVVAILAPTQLLALQHYQTLSSFAQTFNNQNDIKTGKRRICPFKTVQVEILTGSIIGSKRDGLLSRVENASDNEIMFLVGTHALVTSDVVQRLSELRSTSSKESRGLALAVVDEEQRFGVQQRQALSSCAAHTLYMSATPIPRTVGLMGSGLLDVTRLESDPRNVETTIVSSENLDKVVTALKSKINAGSKCFWILPRIGEIEGDSNSTQSSGVLNRHAMLKDTLGQDRVGLVHGRMSIKDREEQLSRFADPTSTVDILVSTTVVEVGIDIKDVDVLIVEQADRFGLSTLHQLRGRIGRKGSSANSCHCLLLSEAENFNNQDGPASSIKRLDILCETLNGQQIADADFHLRGPGDLMGCFQSGIKMGKVVNPYYHLGMLQAATSVGRAFSKEFTLEPLQKGGSQSNDIIMNKLLEGSYTSIYDQSNASYEGGFVLRVMMALFGDWAAKQENNMSNITLGVQTLQQLSSIDGELSFLDKSVDEKILSLFESFSGRNGDAVMIESKSKPLLAPIGSTGNEDIMTTTEIISPQHTKPYIHSLLSISSNRVDLIKEDITFIVLDVETTGLHREAHIIQIAAKVLGSEVESDVFSEYILPPVDKIPEEIERLTGITDSFLRNGGYDSALDREVTGPARSFCDVYLSFSNFCRERAQGKPAVLVAHNAIFDMNRLNGELRRLRHSNISNSSRNSLPMTLSDFFVASVDSLRLFKSKEFWQSFDKPNAPPSPDSFRLGDIFTHVFKERIQNSHNALGDVLALEKLLLHDKIFYGWRRIANEIQVPLPSLSVDRSMTTK